MPPYSPNEALLVDVRGCFMFMKTEFNNVKFDVFLIVKVCFHHIVYRRWIQ